MAGIGSPLFILRYACQKDLMGVLERLGEIGFGGVEFLGMFGHKPKDIRAKLASCGLAAIGNHVPFNEFTLNTQAVINDHYELGCRYITISPPEKDGLPGGDAYGRTIESFNRIGEAVNAAGMTLLYHNHAEELKSGIDGKSILENILDDTPGNALSLEPDLGWIQIGGGDPMHYLDKYVNRCPVIHFKDYMPTESGFIFRPTGYGVVNNAVLYKKSIACKPAWYIMDHDCAYERDIYNDLKMSLDYFKNLVFID